MCGICKHSSDYFIVMNLRPRKIRNQLSQYGLYKTTRGSSLVLVHLFTRSSSRKVPGPGLGTGDLAGQVQSQACSSRDAGGSHMDQAHRNGRGGSRRMSVSAEGCKESRTWRWDKLVWPQTSREIPGQAKPLWRLKAVPTPAVYAEPNLTSQVSVSLLSGPFYNTDVRWILKQSECSIV